MIHDKAALFEALAGAVGVLSAFILISFFIVKTCKLFADIADRPVEEITAEQYWHGVAERELRFERFTGWTECPECLMLDLHRIKDTLPHSCRRQCSNCKYVWRQV